MSKLDLNKLTKLGYQFWVPKRSENSSSEGNLVFYVLDDKTLITGKEDEFKTYPRILLSIKKILARADKEIKEIGQKETISKEFNLVIDFSKTHLAPSSAIFFMPVLSLLKTTRL